MKAYHTRESLHRGNKLQPQPKINKKKNTLQNNVGKKGIEENMDFTVTKGMQYEQWYYLSNSCKI